MLKSSEHEKLWHYVDYGSPNLKGWFELEVRSIDPPIL